MPFSIQDIQQFVPKAEQNVVHDDPAENNVLGNIQLLINELEPVKGKSPRAKAATGSLEHVLNAGRRLESESAGNTHIEQLPMWFSYITQDLVKSSKIDLPVEKREKLRDLMGHVAAGLNLEPKMDGDFEVTEEQKEAAEEIRERGREAVAEEAKLNPEPAAKPFNAYRALEEQKAIVSKMPKRIADPARREEQKAELAKRCAKIFAIRRAANAERNKKSLLMKATVDANDQNRWDRNIDECETFKKFLQDTPYDKLREMAAEGHGGAMEEAFQKYVNNLDRLPGDVPAYYMPTAMQRAEALQAKMDSKYFLTRPVDEQKGLYVELLATREAVQAERNKKSTLEGTLTAKKVQDARDQFEREPLKTVFHRVVTREGGEYAKKAALTGHGGLLEDKIRDEYREMGKAAEYGYSLPGQLPARLRPTHAQRIQDIQDLMMSGRLNYREKMKRFKEFAHLSNLKGAALETPYDAGTLQSVNVGKNVENYEWIASPVIVRKLQNACLKGPDAFNRTVEEVNARYEGDLHAAKVIGDLSKQAEKTDDREKLMELAAKKMVVSYAIAKNYKTAEEEWQKYRIDPISQQVFLKEEVNDAVQNQKNLDQLMKKPAFQKMCDGMSNEELRESIQGNLNDLTVRYSAAENDLKKEDGEAQKTVVQQKNGPEEKNLLIP